MDKVDVLEEDVVSLKQEVSQLKSMVNLLVENDKLWKSQVNKILNNLTSFVPDDSVSVTSDSKTPVKKKEKNAFQKFFTPRGNEDETLNFLKGL